VGVRDRHAAGAGAWSGGTPLPRKGSGGQTRSVRVEPVGPEVLEAVLVERIMGRGAEQGADRRLRVLLDGAATTGPGALADALVDPLRAAGRAAVRVSAEDFLRPASLRWEHGRHAPTAFLEDRLDVAALRREVLDPFGPAGDGRYLPSLWDAERDRATRAPYARAPTGAVLLLDGSMLLGRGLDAELRVHLSVRADTLSRRLPDAERWTLPAYARYEERMRPRDEADVLVLVDDPRRPALVVRL